MKATTVKVEGTLLTQLERIKPARLSLSAYVRSLLEQAIARQQMSEAADRYVAFVRDSPDERSWLADWDSADLGSGSSSTSRDCASRTRWFPESAR